MNFNMGITSFSRKMFSVSLATAALTGTAFGFDFTAADKLFAKRAEGVNQAVAARMAYEEALPHVDTQQEKIYALTQIGRLHIFVGTMIDGLGIDMIPLTERQAMYETCVQQLEAIAETKSQEYFYFMNACLGFRAKLATSLVDRIKWGMKIKDLKEATLASTRNADNQLEGGFEGGGVLRSLAGVYGNIKAQALGYFDPAQAVIYAQKALETEARVVRPFPQTLSGTDFYENYYYLAYALAGLSVKTGDREKAVDALQKLTDTLDEIAYLQEENQLPKGREAETRFYAGAMAFFRADLQSCLDGANWKSCLTEKLENY